MGVMRCCRNNCDNIMCDTYIPKVGYICNECKDEFKEYTYDSECEISFPEFIELIDKFTDTEKGINYKEPIKNLIKKYLDD